MTPGGKKVVAVTVAFFLMMPVALLAASAQYAWAKGIGLNESTLDFGRFGSLHIYRQKEHPPKVVLFVSGDGGWNLGVVDMARELAALDALVVGIDITQYLHAIGRSTERCVYPAADFESLNQFIQKKLGYPDYVQPLLTGYSSGATLVYAVLAQAPANTFQGAISLGFCPDLPLAVPPCRGSGLAWEPGPKKGVFNFLPASNLEAPWVALQGEIDQVCHADNTKNFVHRTSNAELVLLPKVGHGFSVPAHWLPQFKQAYTRLTAEAALPLKMGPPDLPLVEVPPEPPAKPLMAVILSGDGGWAGLDRQVAGYLAERGVGVVGLDSLKYFWKARTPESSAQDLARLITYYRDAWRKDKVLLIGYSLGADVLPFMAARLPDEIRRHIELIALLGPGRRTAFEFHVSEWLGGGRAADQRPVRPEVDKLDDIPLLCIYGKEEHDSLCLDKLPPNVTIIPMAGGHHLDGDYISVAGQIWRRVDSTPGR